MKYSCKAIMVKEKRKSIVDQQSTNKRASKVTVHLLEQPNTKRDASTVSTDHTNYTLKLSRLKIGTMVEKSDGIVGN